MLEHVARVPEAENRLEEPPVARAVESSCGVDVRIGVGERVHGVEVDGHSDARLRRVTPKHLGRAPVGEQYVVGGGERVRVAPTPRSMLPSP